MGVATGPHYQAERSDDYLMKKTSSSSQYVVLEKPPEKLIVTYDHRPGTGPSLVFLHGMGSSRLAFVDLWEHHPVKGNYYAMDFLGFGGSSLPKRRQAIPDYVWTVMSFMQALAIHRPILIGHSFGGMVAGEVAIRYPDRIQGIVLISSAGLVEPQHTLEPSSSILLNRLGIWVTSFDRFGNRMLQSLGLDPHTLSNETRQRMRYGWRRAREMARMRRFYQVSDFLKRLQDSRVPTVLIHGDRDPLFPLELIRREISGTFPVLVQEGAGHLPYDYDLETFSQLFLKALEGIGVKWEG